MRKLYYLSLFTGVLLLSTSNISTARNTIALINDQKFTSLHDENETSEVVLLTINDPDPNTYSLEVGLTVVVADPVAVDDSYSTNEDTPVTITAPGVLDNDTDADLEPLTAVLVTGPSNGGLTLNSDGSFTYTPNADYNGGDSFTYHANDGTTDSNDATVAITVNEVEDTPVATDDSYSTNEDTPLTITAPGVLDNDTDADLEPLTAVLVTGPSNGGLTLNSDGSFTYTPNADYNGGDSFTYHANDGTTDSNDATVAITVNEVEDTPVATDDSYSTNEDTPVTITAPGVLDNDTDADLEPLTAVLVTGPSNGALTLNSDGSFTYTPNADYNGGDSFTYHANDGTTDSNDATVAITVNEVEDTPVATDDSYSTNEDTPLTITAPGVLDNDTDADLEPLTAVLVTGPSNGGLTLNSDGSFTYTPNADYVGNDNFTYHANDGTTNSNDATVTLMVNVVNSAPVAVNDSYSTNEDTPLTIAAPGVLDNDTDADLEPLTAVLVTAPPNGGLTLNSDGSFTYTPNADYNGGDSFTYHANDGTTDSNDATVAITVNEVEDTPVATDDSYSTNEDTPLTITAPGVLDNDTDADLEPLTAVLVTGPSNGGLTLNSDGSFTYTPNADYVGDDNFTYHANDGTTNSNDATVTLTVNAVNSAPVAVNDSYSTNEDTPLTIAAPGVLDNDTDADLEPLTAVLVTGPPNGGLTLNSDGSFTYTPTADYNGSDSFTYHANDGTTDSNDATVAITINEVEDAPVAIDDSYTTDEDTPLTIAAPGVLANDTDVDGETLTAVVDAGPTNGTLTLNADGSFTYTPTANYSGGDSFTYHANDGTSNSNVATVNITVNGVADVPVATNDSYSTNEDTPLTIAAPGVLSNDTGGEGPLTAVVDAGPTNGTLTLNADGSFTYTPTADYSGGDSFTYHANDGTSNSNVATVNITVNGVADVPVATNDSYSTNEDTPLTIAAPGVLSNDTGGEGPLTAVADAGPTNGTLTLNADGSFTYTPTANYSGGDSFTYHANDGTSNSNVATVNITVNGVADVPVATNDSYSTNEDTPLTIAAPGVLSNDTGGEGPLTAVADAGPTNGTLTLNADGSFTYTPTADYSGGDSFTYHANDGTSNSNVATVNITVNGVADVPVATNDSYSTNEDTPLTIAAPGVLGNDTGGEGPLSAVVDAGPTNGTLTLNADGSFTYTPTADYSGGDSFTYHANDGTSNSNVATVNITVNGVADVPVATNDSYSTNEDTPLTIAAPGVLSNDTGGEGPLTAVVDAGPTNGTLTLNADGSFTYTPTADYSGGDSFTYHANDGTSNSNVATVNITVNGVADVPVATNDSYSTNEDTPLTIAAPGVLSNDTGGEGPLTAVVDAGPTNGTLTLNADGSFTYTPTADYSGGDSFTYHANDGTSNSNVATVTLTVNPVSDAPVAVNDSYTANEDIPLVVVTPGVLGNDTDIDGGTLSASVGTGPLNGMLLLNANGSFNYEPNSNYNGSDSFTYQANDGTTSSNTATVTITINQVDDAPSAIDDSYATNEDTPLTIATPGVLGNDTDVEGGTLTAIAGTPSSNGTLALNTDGSFTYTPTADYNGSDSFTYHANDGTTDSNDATVAITINEVEDAPVAIDDSYTTDEDTPLTIAAPGVLANDTDVDGETLTAVVDAGPTNGTLTLNADGSFTYTPTADYSGGDSFTYHANDGTSNSNVATVNITVNGVADVPVATNDSYSTNEDTPLTIAAPGVLSNDTGGEGPLTAVADAGPTNGTLTLNADGSFTYTPTADYSGGDSFTYHANDGTSNSNVATVNITVNGVADVPVATNDSYSTNEDTPLTIAAPGVLSNDTGGEGPLSAVVDAGPTNGTLTLNADGSFTYTPTADYSGGDSFTYHANDGTSNSNVATVNITVNGVADVPVATNDSYSTNEDTPLTIAAPGVLSNDTGGEGPLTAVADAGPTNGTLTLNADGSFTYTPTADYSGGDSFTYHANDGTSNSNVATVNITVNGVADVPVATNDSYSTNEDTPLTIAAPGVLGNDTGGEGPLSAVVDAGPTNGTLTLNADGSFTYTPTADYSGGDSFTYHANDGTSNSNVATVNITVNGVADVPVATNDSYSTNEDTPLTIAAPGVLSNDTGGEGPLTAVVDAGPTNGTLTLNANGSFTYTPTADYSGGDSFTYHANDGTSNSNVATVTLTVNPVSDAPVAVNDSYTANEDIPLVVVTPGVLGNDTDIDGGTLSASVGTGPLNGMLLLNANGSFNYEPNSNYNGSDSFTYQANDGTTSSNTATVTITINQVNDAPSAIDDSYSTNEDTPLTIAIPGVLGNDTDVEGGTLTAIAGTPSSNGSLALNADGSFTYTPNANYNGSDSFTYHASDGATNSNDATVAITINEVEDAPVAIDDSYTTDEDTPLTIAAPGVLANDTDVDGETLTVVPGTGPANGTLTLNADGSFTYTPNANYNGSDSFTYQANDGTTSSNAATVNITVNGVVDVPVATNDSYSTNEDTPLTIAAPGVLANDTGVEGALTVVPGTGPTNGTLTLNANGSFTYTPNANYNGSDSFTYQANDGTTSSNVATVAITVTPVIDVPVAANDSYSTNEDTPLTIAAPGVLTNDTGVDGALTVVPGTGPTNGTLTLNANGSFTYTPNANYNGSDSFTYQANDGTTNSNVATVTITITPVIDAPVAANDAYSTNEDTPLTIAAPGVLTNDTGVEGALTVVPGTDPTNGTLTLNANGSFTYTPNANYNGSDSFTYVANDGTTNSAPATVTLTVTPVNDLPVAQDDSYAVNEDTPLTIAVPGLLTNDTDVEGGPLTAAAGTGPSNGTLTLNANGSFTYTPNANYNGSDSFTYVANDGTVNSTPGTVTITVTPINDPPTLNAISNVSVSENAPAQVINLSGITAGPGETQTLTVTATHDAPALLDDIIITYTSANSTGSLTVTPLPNVSGSGTVTVRVEDNGSNVAPNVNFSERTFTFTVTDVNAPPTIAFIDNVTVDEDAPAQVVNLSGISPGPSETGSVTITATSSNAGIVPDPIITHDGASATGTLTFQPVANRNGTVTISVTAVDAGGAEFTRTFAVTVNSVNDAPTLDAIANVSVAENSPAQVINLAGISAGNAFETQTLTVTASHNNSTLLDPITVSYTSANPTGTLTITPNPNVSGTATVTVTITDNGSSVLPNVNTFQRTFTFSVNDVNDPPVFDAIANASVLEDAGAQTANITGISPGVGETGTVTLSATSSNTAIIPDPTITYDGTSTSAILNYQSEADRNGTVTITVRAVDVGALEFTRTFTINVQPVNDAPTLDVIANVSVGEDAGLQSINLTGIGDGSSFETQGLTVTVTSDNTAALFDELAVNYATPEATGVLNIQPKADVTGSANVTVTVTDAGSGTAPDVNTFSRTFTFSINDVNDPPTFDPIADVTVNEDVVSPSVNITGISPGPGETQGVTLSATSANPAIVPNPAIVHDGSSATATLNFQPEANQSGSVVITVRAVDAEAVEFIRTFTINVQSINDAPTLDALGNITIQEDEDEQILSLTGITSGPLESQALSVTASTNQPGYFEVFTISYTNPQSSGLLTVKPNANITGTATITVTVTDNGSGVSPNVNSISRTFDLTINPANDGPVIVNQTPSPVTINEDNAFTISLSNLTIQDPDNSSGFTLSVGAGSNYTFLGNAITPNAHYYGSLSVPVTVSDGTTASQPFNFIINVSPVNDAPQIVGQNPVSVDEAQPIPLDLNMLIVDDHDPEDVYPDDYTLNILSGANYSVSGNTVIPVANFSGVLTVRVFVNDGVANSNTFNLQIQVDFVNDPPVITAQNTEIEIDEDNSTTLSVTQLTITDPDNTSGFVLTVLPNTNYTLNGLAVTPNANYNGDLPVFVTVSDGFVNSAPFTMHITVNPVNDVPTITGQNAVTTVEDVKVTLKLTDLIASDIDTDDPYPGAFTMSASAGTNYTVNGLEITPAQNYSGMLTVPVVVNDGQANSNTFDLQIQVTPANDAPVIVNQTPNPLTTSEDIPVEITLDNLQVTDVESTPPTGFSIIVQSGTNYTFNGTTITPAADYVGSLTVVLRVSDGSAQSLPFNFQILVGPQNDPPVITGQNPVSVQEDGSVEIQPSQLIIDDPDANETFTLTVLPPGPSSNYTIVEGTTIQPNPNFFGNLSVSVRVTDGFNNSPAYPMVVQVTPVNDAPSFDVIPDLILAENAPTQMVEIKNISPGPLETQQLVMSIGSSNSQVIEAPPITYNGSSGTYTFPITPKPNQTGEVIITVTVVDPGLLQFTQTFTVSVTNINDAPTLDPITFGPISEDPSGVQSINLTGITAGPQESQVLTVTATTDNPELFETFTVTYTSPQTTGKLNIELKPDAFGSASITVRVTDDGSNTLPHKNFIERTFTLTITPVNDAPVFTSTPVEIAVIGELYQYIIEVSDVDLNDVITISAIDIPAWLTLTAQGNGQALLSGTPPSNAVGAVSVKLQAIDAGNAMTAQDYTLRINTRPLVSNFSIMLNEDELKPIGLSNFTSAYTDIDNDALQKIQIVKLPDFGQLLLNSQVVSLDQEIDAAALANLVYRPQQDYVDNDTIEWKASDALSYSLNAAKIFISISPVNDPPVIVDLEQDVLQFIVGEGPGIISTEFEAIDVDSEMLTGAEIGFRRQNFVPEIDMLYFENTPGITGEYDEIAGILTLTGTATVEEYNAAIRSITYDNISEVFSSEEVIKTIYYTVNDGTALSDTRDREIRLIDLFEELVIPKGFTPNDDPKNNTWTITNINRYTEAIVKVYNIRGMEVYSSEGIYEEWDGTYKDKSLPSDTYYYVIDLNLPFRKKVYTGAVTILR